jgi:hypothetical protein
MVEICIKIMVGVYRQATNEIMIPYLFYLFSEIDEQQCGKVVFRSSRELPV